MQKRSSHHKRAAEAAARKRGEEELHRSLHPEQVRAVVSHR